MKRQSKIALLVLGVFVGLNVLMVVVIYFFFKILYLDPLNDALNGSHTVLNVLYSGNAVLCA